MDEQCWPGDHFRTSTSARSSREHLNEAESSRNSGRSSKACAGKQPSRQRSLHLPEVVDFSRNNEKEVYHSDEKQVTGASGKQVVREENFPEAFDEEGGKEVVQPSITPAAQERPRGQLILLSRVAWDRKAKRAFAAILLIVLLSIGLIVGLGLGLQSTSTSLPSPTGTSQIIGGALDPAFYSTAGAFNGTGLSITLAAASGIGSNLPKLAMYFQHWTGQIRTLELTSDDVWIGGNASSIVATDAKNNTPISALSYGFNNSDEWHVFYIDGQNKIKERYRRGMNGTWKDGIINNLDATAFDNEQAGLAVCGSEHINGDMNLADNSSNSAGAWLWYASNSTTFQQLAWRYTYNAWEHDQSWSNLNGFTSPGCSNSANTSYTIFADLYGVINIYWQDTAWNQLSTATHPVNQWVNSSISIPGVAGAAQLSYNNILYGQSQSDHTIRGYNVTWAAENSTILPDSDLVIGDATALPGTRLIASSLFDLSPDGVHYETYLLVFFQTNGSDITEYRRPVLGETWTNRSLPIPHD